MKANTFDSLLSQVRSHITSCLNCQPYEDGEPGVSAKFNRQRLNSM